MPERIIRLKGYIEECLGEEIDSKAIDESCGDMKVLVIKDTTIYHKIAQQFKITELINSGNLHYNIEIENEKWDIILPKKVKIQFETKYKQEYKIVKPKYNLN
jgi:hypothetical protein